MSSELAARIVALVLVAVASVVPAADVPVPTVTGAITGGTLGGPFIASTSIDLGAFGYAEEEFFVAGTARAFGADGELGGDGRWTATPGATADYTTRILVRRPVDPRRFNGTVLVEWLNVSGGLDTSPDWTYMHPFLLRDGYAWVGVSAQRVGVQGGGPLGLRLGLKQVDPVRYGALNHPGDSFSYDMFSQVAAVLRAPGDVPPLRYLRPRRIVAIGESQSAFRLVTYVNAIHPLAHVYDGFLIHSRGGGAAPLAQSPQPAVGTPTPAFLRDDLDVPVLTFETETDLIALGFYPARQPDTDRLRLWEVAGTAHADVYQLVVGPDDAGKAAADTTFFPPTTGVAGGVIECDSPINAGPQQHVLAAAVRALTRWVRMGRATGRLAPRLAIAPGPPPAIVRDAYGNAVGGIRTAQVDVPVAALSGLGQAGETFCGLFGTTVPLDPATLATLYPTHDAYVAGVVRATNAAVRQGFMLPPEGRNVRAAAVASSIGE